MRCLVSCPRPIFFLRRLRYVLAKFLQGVRCAGAGAADRLSRAAARRRARLPVRGVRRENRRSGVGRRRRRRAHWRLFHVRRRIVARIRRSAAAASGAHRSVKPVGVQPVNGGVGRQNERRRAAIHFQ